MELEAGTQVNPNVRLTRVLGRGAMGTVWVAEHLTLRTEVAVKFISPELVVAQPEVATRFEREAAVTAQIKSPHVVQTFDCGAMEDGTRYIVMELLDGKSLWQKLEDDGPLTIDETAQVVGQVARALRRAHDLGIVHRDIKPDNIFVSTTDEGLFCKVLDFGIAKQSKVPQLEGLTGVGMLVGTPEYMSPEQFLSSADVDSQADVWALGVTAYQCLTTQFPFPAKTLGALCAELMKGTFAPPSDFRDDLPPEVDSWFLRALAKEPGDRFQTARELARSFATLLPPGDRAIDDTGAYSVRGEPPESASRISVLLPSAAPIPASSQVVATLSGSSTATGGASIPMRARFGGAGAWLVAAAVLLLGGVVWSLSRPKSHPAATASASVAVAVDALPSAAVARLPSHDATGPLVTPSAIVSSAVADAASPTDVAASKALPKNKVSPSTTMVASPPPATKSGPGNYGF